jgi:hypothetical protein
MLSRVGEKEQINVTKEFIDDYTLCRAIGYGMQFWQTSHTKSNLNTPSRTRNGN